MTVRRDDGAGTALVIALIGVTAVVGMAMLGASAATATRHRAMVAADLAALAGASVAAGIVPGTPCAAATSTAWANGAVVAECRQKGTRVSVSARVTGPFGQAGATAVAGPAA